MYPETGSPSSLLKTDAFEAITLTDDFADNFFDLDLTTNNGAKDFASYLNRLLLMFNYQLGASETSNVLNIQIEVGVDADDLYILDTGSVSGADVTIVEQIIKFTGANATAPYKEAYPLDFTGRYIRVSVKETNVASNFGTLSMKTLLAHS